MARTLRDAGWVRHLAILLLFGGLAVLMTWPVALRLTTHLAGGQADNQLFVWTLWVLNQQLREGVTPFFTTYIYFPDGISLAIHTMVWTKNIPALLLQSFMDVDTAYNLLVLVSLALNGYTMWLLARYLTGDSTVAVVSGIIYAFAPIVLAHAVAGHLNLTGVEGLPLFAYFLLKALDSRRWQDAVYAGLAAAYTLLTDWTLGLFAALFVVILFAYRLIAQRRQHLRWQVLRQYLLMATTAIIAASPVLLPTLAATGSGEYDMTHYIGGAALYVSDLFAFFTPSPDHFLLGDRIQPFFSRFTGGATEGTVFVGFAVLLLTVIGVWKTAWRKIGLWVVVFLVFALISLGPGLHVMGAYRFPWLAWLPMGSIARDLGVPMKAEWVQMFDEAPMIPLPGAVLQLTPLFKWTRAYSRYFIVSMMALAVLAGYGLVYVRSRPQLQRLWGGRLATWLAAIAGAIVLVEFCIAPFPTVSLPLPTSLSQVTAEQGRFALLDLPIRPFQLRPQYWQTQHGKPLVYAHISRVPEERFAYLEQLQHEVYAPSGFFQQADIRYLVLHKSHLAEMPQEEAQALLSALESQYRVAAEDDELRIYFAYESSESGSSLPVRDVSATPAQNNRQAGGNGS